MWTSKFAFIEVNGNPQCVISHSRLQNNKSSNIERQFYSKHLDFSKKYPDGDNGRKAIDNLVNNTKSTKQFVILGEIVVKCY